MMYSTHVLLGCHLCILGVVIAHDGIATREEKTSHDTHITGTAEYNDQHTLAMATNNEVSLVVENI